MAHLRRILALAGLAAALALPAPALASHMNSYGYIPVEHDDQGRSYEPDFLATAVLGPALRNCIVSTNLAPGCIADPSLPPPAPGQSVYLAPGCTDDQGRQPSGLCGLYTVGAGHGAVGTIVPPGQVGTPGMSGNAAPGRFTPTKGTVIRFLDARLDLSLAPPAGGVAFVDYNSKFRDDGVQDLLGGLDGNLGQDAILPGGTGMWAWYGTWQDKNGNGVIDHLRSAVECSATTNTCPPEGGVAPGNEFVWLGRCLQANGQAAPTGQKFCRFEADTLMPAWVYPGNHHAFCGFAIAPPNPQCGVIPGDAPGRAAVAYVVSPCPGPDCGQGMADTEAFLWGDPLLGEQDSRRVDNNGAGGFGPHWGFADRTGDALAANRHWVYGNGYPVWFYDQSLLVGTVVVTGVTKDAPIPGLATDFDLARLLAVDVDQYRTWSPVAEALLMQSVKPAARDVWLLARGGLAAGDPFAPLDGGPATRLTYDECDPHLGVCLGTQSSVVLGHAADQAYDPGWAKEPNTALDVYPGAARGTCTGEAAGFRTHQGLCNTYAGYATGFHAWLEVQEFNAWYPSIAWRTPLGSCVLCTTSGPSGTADLPDGLRAPDEYTRVLDPGSHVFGGVYGAWADTSRTRREAALDPLASLAGLGLRYRTADYVVGPDGWIGDVVASTGFERVAGFLPEACAVHGAAGVHEYAQCHPYADGNLDGGIFGGSAPQDYGSAEFTPGDRAGGQGPLGHWLLRLTPADGCWDTPIFVWRAFDSWTIGDTTALQDYTNTCGAVTLDLGEGSGGAFAGKDLVVLPAGSTEPILSEVAGTVTVRVGGTVVVREFVRDVDAYGVWSAP